MKFTAEDITHISPEDLKYDEDLHSSGHNLSAIIFKKCVKMGPGPLPDPPKLIACSKANEMPVCFSGYPDES